MRLLNAIFGIVVITVACFKNDIRKLCWEEYTKSKLCFPKYEKCLISGNEIVGCKDSFEICVQSGTVFKHTEFCNKQILNLTIPPKTTNETYWHTTFLDETLDYSGSSKGKQSQKETNCDLHNLLFKTMKPKITNELITRMPSLASLYCPCLKTSDDGSEVIRSSKMSVPLQMWHGGFSSKKCWREMDRFLVEYLCGVTVALEINHIWAKSVDCHEDPNRKSNCRSSFDLSLKNSVNMSSVQSACQLYYEMIDAYLPTSQTPSFEYKITYINTTDLIYLQQFEYRDDRLYLMNSFEENAYFTCFSIKREVSSCNYMFEHCKINGNSEKCGEKLIDCLSKTTPFSEECKNFLVQRNDNIGTFEKIYHFIMNNKLQLAWPVILYIFWTLTKSVINWILLSISIKICLKISSIFDQWSEQLNQATSRIKNQTENPAEFELEPISNTPNSMITVPNAFEEISLETEPERGNNNNNNNDNNANETLESVEEAEENKKKEKENLNFGQSFRKLILSFCRLIRSVYEFIDSFIRNCF